jgi:glycosyltransferase involved in cell wall biosynthesis
LLLPALRRLYRRLLDAVTRPERQRVITNVLAAPETPGAKRALVIYVAGAFTLAPDDPRLLSHQNRRQCRQIIHALGRLDYVVDLVDIANRTFRVTRPYDLVLTNRGDISAFASLLSQKPIVLYLATTLERRRHNENLRERHRRLVDRGRPPVRVRRLYREALPVVDCATAIAAFGNETTAGSWRTVFDGPIHPFNNYGFAETVYQGDDKDYEAAVCHFVYFASKSQMQKGLDLLLEVFPRHPHLHLHVCGPFEGERDFCECYRKELYETPNIHPVGFVRVNRPAFYELIRRCAWVIHPTCSDGQAGSVVQCMYAGTVPIVTREAGIDVGDFGILLPDDSLETLERTILRAVASDPAECRERTRRTRAAAEIIHSEAAFEQRWDAILKEVVQRGGSNAAH